MIKRIFTGFLFVFITAFSAQAAEKVSACHGSGGYPPYHFSDPDNPDKVRMVGVSIDLTKAIFDQLPYDLEIVALPWKRCFNKAKDSLGYDMIIDGSYKIEREVFFAYSETLHNLNPAVALRENSSWAKHQKITAEQLEGAVICSNRGTNLKPYGFSDKQVPTRASGVAQGLQMVATDRCDGYLTLQQVYEGHYRIDTDNKLPRGIVIRPIDTNKTFNLHLMISKKRPDAVKLRNEINVAIQALRKDGTIDRLWQPYLGD